MRLHIYIIALLLSPHLASSQNQVSYFDFIEDRLKIPNGEEQKHFDYALTLLRQDSTIKAYQILWRVSQTGSLDPKRVDGVIKKTKQKITNQYNKLFRNAWELSFEGYSTYMRKRDSVRSEKIIISKKKIRFYEKGRLTKEYKYNSEIQIDPLFGFVSYLVRYKTSSEEWIYNLECNAMGNTQLALEPKEGAIDAKYYAVYTRIIK